MAVTLQQIALKSGVATSTVSAVLSPVCKKRVSPKKKRQIRDIAKKMGYRPNLSARQLRTGQTFKIGIVIPSFLSHHPLSTYFDLTSLACAKRGYHAIPLVVERNCDIMSKQMHILESHHVDGLLFFDYMRQSFEQYLQFWQQNDPMVFRFLDPILTSLPFKGVLVDHFNAGKKLLEHLVDNGWTDVYFVSETIEERVWEKGYGRAWVEFNAQIYGTGLNNNIIEYQNRSALARYTAIKQFVQSNSIQKGRTAFVLDGGDGSSGVYSALSDAGLIIGRDVAVAAMNSIPANEFVSPQLTTLTEPYEAIVDSLVSELLSEIQPDQDCPISQRVYEPELVIRASTIRKKVINKIQSRVQVAM